MNASTESNVTPLTSDPDADYEVGYGRPPLHSRFQPGVSGNPSGRAKGSQNLKTLFHRILKEHVPLREGSVVKNVSKAEALMRTLVVSAMKGDPKAVVTLFRLAEQLGEFEEKAEPITEIRRIIVDTGVRRNGDANPFPAIKEVSTEER